MFDTELFQFQDSLPDHLVSWNMIRVPDQLELGVNDLWVCETEVTWELFDIWALQLDVPQEQQVQGVDASSRPSKPYSVIFTNFGHHGHPAICMSFLNAQRFCEWLSSKASRSYRLPTEVEWNYACRAGQAEPLNLDEISWNWDNAEDVTHRVGTRQPNAWGLKDMLGNVAEWCVGEGGEHVVRGGSWMTKPADLSSNHREIETSK